MHTYINTVYLRLTIGYRQVVKYMCGFTPLWTLVCPSASGSAVDAQDQPGRAVKCHLGLVGILLVPRAWLADPDMSGPSLSRGHTCCSERPQTAGCKEVLASELGPLQGTQGGGGNLGTRCPLPLLHSHGL